MEKLQQSQSLASSQLIEVAEIVREVSEDLETTEKVKRRRDMIQHN